MQTYTYLSLLVAVVTVFISHNGVTDGTFPLMHLAPFGYSDSQIPASLTNTTALVTGASSGLGLAVATRLARAGCHVIATARSKRQCDETLAVLDSPTATCVELELLSLKSVLAAARAIVASTPSLDLLVLNAGVMMPPFSLSPDGFESQFATNHLGHQLLARELLPSLTRGAATAPAARVVAVSSVGHWFAAPAHAMLDLAVLNDAATYDKAAWYGFSKLCNILFAREFSRRVARSNTGGRTVVAHAIHPGGVQGKLLRHVGPESVTRLFESLLYWTAPTAALTVLRPLLDPAFGAAESAGTYFVPIARVGTSSKEAQDPQLAAKLFDISDNFIDAALNA